MPAPARELRADSGALTPDSTRGWLTALVTLVGLLPVLVTTVTRWGSDYLPVQDFAVIDLRVRDVWSRDIPLVGAYSRYGWSHPGPIATWLVAPLSLLTGRPAWATLVGFALLQGVAIGLIGWLGWRHLDLHKTLFWFGVLSLGYLATGPWIYLEPWNPHVALPFFTLLAMLTWMVASGETAVLPWWVLAATFVVQTHLGYAPAVVVAAALVGPSVVRLIRARGRAWFADKTLKWSAALLAVLWLPVVLETIVHFPGNVAEIVNHQVLHPSDPHHGLLSSLRLFATNFRGLPVWLGGADPASPIDGGLLESSLGWLLLPVAAVVALAWAARGLPRRFRELERLAIGMIVAAFVAYLSTTGPQVPYLVYWVYPAAALLLLATAVVVARRLGLLRIAWVPRAGAVLLVVPVVWASVALTVDVATHRRNYDRFEPVARELLGQLRAEGQPAGPVLVRFAGSPLGGLQGGIIDELDRNGAEVRVDPSGPHQFGYSRTARPEDVESVWYVAETGEVLDALASQPGATVVAETHPLSPQDQAEYDAIQDRIRAALVANGRDDLLPQLSSPYLAFVVEGIPGITKADLDRRSTLFDQQQRAVCHCGIVAFPPDQLPNP